MRNHTIFIGLALLVSFGAIISCKEKEAIQTSELQPSALGHPDWPGCLQRKYYRIPQIFIDDGFSASIWVENSVLGTDYDFTSLDASITGETGYIDINASDGGDGTQGRPYNDVNAALADIAYNRYLIAAGRYDKAHGWRGGQFAKDISLICPSGYAEITTEIPINWVAVGSIYKGSNQNDQVVMNAIQDLAERNSDGTPIGYFRVTSKAAVQARPGSFWYDVSNNELYIRCLGDRQPDGDIRVFLSGFNLDTNANTTNKIYCKGIKFFGGQNRLRNGSGNQFRSVGFDDCEFSYGGVKDGITTNNNAKVYGFYKDCKSSYNLGDGFNYNQVDGGVFLEWNCKAKYTAQANNGCNGSTAHSKSRVIRIGGEYFGHAGKAIQDIGTSITYSLRCTVGGSIATANQHRASFATAFGTASVHYWIECSSSETSDINKYWVADQATANIYDGRVGNLLVGNSQEDWGSTVNELTESEVYE